MGIKGKTKQGNITYKNIFNEPYALVRKWQGTDVYFYIQKNTRKTFDKNYVTLTTTESYILTGDEWEGQRNGFYYDGYKNRTPYNPFSKTILDDFMVNRFEFMKTKLKEKGYKL